MAGIVLSLRVVEAALRETGDGRGRVGQNVVNVVLLWPRPGKAEVLGTTGLVPLSDHVRAGAATDRPPSFDAPILKEVVEGDCALLVQVLDRDEPAKFARFLLALASAGVETAAGAAVTAVPGILRHVFTEAAENGSVLLGTSGRASDRVDVVAVSARPLLIAESQLAALATSGEAQSISIDLIAPSDLARPGEKGPLAPGRPNGSLTLELRAFSR